MPGKRSDLRNITNSSFYKQEESIFSVTCPADILDLENSLDKLRLEETKYEKRVEDAASAFAHDDPCSWADDEREAIMRDKRIKDAYKTILCEAFRLTGYCAYGGSCRFAHGPDELRLPPIPRGRNHPKYKTVLCERFTSTGYCKYGARCQFIHKNMTTLNSSFMRADSSGTSECFSEDCYQNLSSASSSETSSIRSSYCSNRRNITEFKLNRSIQPSLFTHRTIAHTGKPRERRPWAPE